MALQMADWGRTTKIVTDVVHKNIRQFFLQKLFLDILLLYEDAIVYGTVERHFALKIKLISLLKVTS